MIPPPASLEQCHNTLEHEAPYPSSDASKREKVQCILDFEKAMQQVTHKKCLQCLSVSLTLKGHIMPSRGGFICDKCQKLPPDRNHEYLPYWTDPVTHKIQYNVPPELRNLSEGEKLLIQMVAPYVPLQHLRKGAFACHGHVCSFPKDIVSVCTDLPRKSVEAVRVIRHFKMENNDIDSRAFIVRKTRVLDALKWLCIHHEDYKKEVRIVEENLDWMNGKEEADLDTDIILDAKTTNDPSTTEDSSATKEDSSQIHRSYGILQHIPKDSDPSFKDDNITKGIRGALQKGQQKLDNKTMMFPYVSPEPTNELEDNCGLFRKAFPWLFPGAKGDITSAGDYDTSIETWMKYLLMYFDGRFAKDKIWSFFVLNFAQRRLNQKQGSYFVNGFFEQGPKTLEEIQDAIADGDLEWVNRIAYFGARIRGSSAYWRERRQEIYAWINHHIQMGHGAPQFFITLSCAEYHWPDIQRLLQERYDIAGEKVPDFSVKKGLSKYINEFTIVIQEYFQLRVRQWLKTIGKQIFGIDHYWLRFEFAPGRGQIHAHMIAITNKMKDVSILLSNIRDGTSSFGQVHNPESLCAHVLQQWASEHLGLTAQVLNTKETSHATITTNELPHPASQRFTDVHSDTLAHDANNFLRTCQEHICSQHCLRKRKHINGNKEHNISKARRECRAGCGIEQTAGKGDTPGFPLTKCPIIHMDSRGFKQLRLPRKLSIRKNKRRRNPIQTSLWLAHGWRANCDLQIILYDGHPDHPDPAEIARLTDYIVAYASKGVETFSEERHQTQEQIRAAKENTGDSRDVTRLARKILNMSLAHKILSKQEAMVHILNLDLFLSTETFHRISLSDFYKLQDSATSSKSGKAFLQKYAGRPMSLAPLSLNEYFYKFFSQKKNKQGETLNIVPFYTGAMTTPVFPPTSAYAKFILMVHKPWIDSFCRTKRGQPEPDFLGDFNRFLRSPTCPQHVKVQFERTKYKYEHPTREPTTETTQCGTDADTPDDVAEAVSLYSILTQNEQSPKDCYDYDFGETHEWSTPCIPLQEDPTSWLDLMISEHEKHSQKHLIVPTKRVVKPNGSTEFSDFELEDLYPDQRNVADYVLDTLKQYEQCRQQPKEPMPFHPIRTTITGQAGTGKTILIKTLLSVLRKKYQRNDVAYSFGPTGSAAKGVDGKTVHTGFGLSIKKPDREPSNKKKALLRTTYSNTLILIFDERSMYNASDMACIENYIRHAFHCGSSYHDPSGWGGIPVVLLFGDDHQLPSFNHGCLSCVYYMNLMTGPVPTDPDTRQGLQVFADLSKHVMHLSIIKRQDSSQTSFLQALQHLREGESTQEDAEYLMTLHLDDITYSEKDRDVIKKQSMFLFATRDACDQHNDYMLYKTHTPTNPVAKIKAHHNLLKPRANHFTDDNLPRCVRICIGALVMLSGRNINPDWGLYNGALGTVVDIVFHQQESPNLHSLPAYVLVDFPSYSGPSLQGQKKTFVPITPITIDCNNTNCHSCTRTQIPLRLAFASTAHKAQGITVGPNRPGQPPSTVQSIICDPGNLSSETWASGILYTMCSRATNATIANDKTSSALYFQGKNMNTNRILKVAQKKDGTPLKKITEKLCWIKYLESNTKPFQIKPYASEQLRIWAQQKFTS